MRQIMSSIDWHELVPDNGIILSDRGTLWAEIIAARSSNGDLIMVSFSEDGTGSARIDLGDITSDTSVQGTWMNPNNGNTQDAGVHSTSDDPWFTIPSTWTDAVLKLEGTASTPTCQSQGHQCCDSCESGPHPEYDTDCSLQVCCEVCTTSNELIGHWTMDSADISGDTISDKSGNGNDGTIYGAVSTSGEIGEALLFDVDDYVDFGNPASLQITGELTVSAWFRLDTEANSYLITKGGNFPTNFGYDLSFNIAPARMEFRVCDGSSMFSSGDENIEVGTTHHAVGVFSPSNYVRLYLDGDPVQENTVNIPAAILNSNANLIFSRDSNFDGMLDDVRVYNYALTPAEISELFADTTLNTPQDNHNTSQTQITFNCTARDGLNLTNVTLYGSWNTWHANETNSTPVSGTPVLFTKTLTEGTYEWNCYACDNSSNCSFATSNYTFTIDTTPPDSDNPNNAQYSQNAEATINWTMTDNYGTGYYYIPRNSTIQNSSTPWTNDTQINVWVNTSTIGTWNYTVLFNDSVGNDGTPDEVIITITGDETKPTWHLNKTNSSAAIKTQQTVYFNITLNDDTTGDKYLFSFNNGSQWTNDTAETWNSGQELIETRTITATRGDTISWYWWFNDSSGNLNQTDSWSFSVANTAPSQPILTYTNNLNTSAQPTLTWTNATDADNDALTHTIYISNTSEFTHINQSSSGNQQYITIGLTDGTWYWKVNASDTYANTSSEIRQFMIDATLPIISITTPENTTCATSPQLNFTYTETNPHTCRYSLNSGANITLLSCDTNGTIMTSTYGANNIILYMNDSAGNENHTQQYWTFDDRPPQYSANTTTPQSPQTYSPILQIQFNITAEDQYSAIDTVLLEFNSINHTTTNTSATYTTNITSVAAGTYNYRWHMNDTLGNMNSTPIMTYIINKAETTLTILLNSTDSDKTYYAPATVNATYTINHNQATANMYRNTTLLTLAGNTNITTYLSAATYNYTINTSATQNYTSAATSHIAVILEHPMPTITDWQNNITDNQQLSITINETQSVFFNITADQDVDYVWYENTSVVSATKNYTYTNAQASTYNITAIINNTNGTDSIAWSLSVKDIPNINSVQESADPVSINSTISIEANITDLDGDLEGKFAVIEGIWYEMQPNGQDKYIANYIPTEEKLYTYHIYANDTTGLYANQSYTFTAQHGPSVTNITVTPESGNETTNFTISANATDYNSVDKVYAKFTQPNIFEIELTNQTLDIYNTVYNSTTPATYIFYIRANDTLGTATSTSTYSFTINDTIDPIIYSVSITPAQKNETAIITINANITDFNISTVHANITGPQNTIRTLTYNGSIYKNTTGAIPHTPGFYNITITAIDASGNRATFITNYTINDMQAPVLNTLSVIPGIGNYGVSFNITANITDNDAVNASYVNITKPDSGHVSDIIIFSGLTPYSAIFTNTTWLGLYTVNIFANDSAGNILYTDCPYPLGAANFSVHDTELPIINELNVTASVNTTQELEISANVTDDNAVNYVTANITRPDSYPILLTSFTNTTDIYSANFTETTIPGFYTVLFTAVDIAGNTSTAVSNFTANDTVAPQITLFSADDYTPDIDQRITFTMISSDNDIVNKVTGTVNITKPDNTSIIVPVAEISSVEEGSPPTSVVVQSEANYTPDRAGNYTATLTITDQMNSTDESTIAFEAFDVTGPVLGSISISAVEGQNITANITTDEESNYTFAYDAGFGWCYASNSSFRINHTITLPEFNANAVVLYYINLTDIYGNAGRYPLSGVLNFTVEGELEFNQSSIELNLTEKEARMIQVELTNPSSIAINVTFNKTRSWTTIQASRYLNPLEMAVINITLAPDDTSAGDWYVNEMITAHGSAQDTFFINMTVFHKCGDGECDSGETCSNCVSDCGTCSTPPGGGGGSSGGAPFMPPVHECENNSGCLQIQICENYECIDIECGYCKYAKDHECKEYKCCADSECKEGWVCEDHECIKIEEDTNETVVPGIKEDARRAIGDVRSFILQRSLNKETSESEVVLREAQLAFDRQDYEKAFDLAEKAKELADSAPMREVPEEPGDEKFNWSLAIGIVLLVIILALAYLKRDVVRRFTGKYTKTSQWHKIYEIEDYINLIRPIITNMKNEKYETKLLEIEGMKDEADRMLKDNNPLAGEQIQLVVDALIKLKKDVEGH